MKLSNRTLSALAEMICGASGGMTGFSWEHFPYRSSSYLTEFFTNCDLDYVHDGSTRKLWVQNTLDELNNFPSSNQHLPSTSIIRVIQELMDPTDFEQHNLDRLSALASLNQTLSRDGLKAYFDNLGRCQIKHVGTSVSSTGLHVQKRAWTTEELKRRKDFLSFLDNASEDEFIEQLLAPLFRQLGFIRISVTGHNDKRLEFGKDLWMKFQLPTNHYIYFGAQVKIGKLDASGKSKNTNIAEVLTQINMMLNHPIWDSETNRRNLLDHVYIISAGDITKQAKQWLGERLDIESRRHILFLDRDDILDLAVGTNLKLPKDDHFNDEIPF